MYSPLKLLPVPVWPPSRSRQPMVSTHRSSSCTIPLSALFLPQKQTSLLAFISFISSLEPFIKRIVHYKLFCVWLLLNICVWKVHPRCALRVLVACCTVLQDVSIPILFLLVFRLFLWVAFVDNAAVNALVIFHVRFSHLLLGLHLRVEHPHQRTRVYFTH